MPPGGATCAVLPGARWYVTCDCCCPCVTLWRPQLTPSLTNISCQFVSCLCLLALSSLHLTIRYVCFIYPIIVVLFVVSRQQSFYCLMGREDSLQHYCFRKTKTDTDTTRLLISMGGRIRRRIVAKR